LQHRAEDVGSYYQKEEISPVETQMPWLDEEVVSDFFVDGEDVEEVWVAVCPWSEWL
jgi:hypothetical protein